MARAPGHEARLFPVAPRAGGVAVERVIERRGQAVGVAAVVGGVVAAVSGGARLGRLAELGLADGRHSPRAGVEPEPLHLAAGPVAAKRLCIICTASARCLSSPSPDRRRSRARRLAWLSLRACALAMRSKSSLPGGTSESM